MLCRSGQLRSSSVFTHFDSDSSAATSSARIEYGTVPERPFKNEEQSNINEEWTKNKRRSGPNCIKMMRSKIRCTFLACKQ